jgi:hypothetical protein
MEVLMVQRLRGIGHAGVVTGILSGFLLMGLVWFSGSPATIAQGAKGGWLAPLAPEAQLEALERQLRGFDMAIEGNWEYALYTAEKIGVAIENGLERRPKRRANAETIFLKSVYPAVLEALKQKDPTLFKQRFDSLRSACNACHAAEEVAFVRVGIPTLKQTPLVNN